MQNEIKQLYDELRSHQKEAYKQIFKPEIHHQKEYTQVEDIKKKKEVNEMVEKALIKSHLINRSNKKTKTNIAIDINLQNDQENFQLPQITR